MKWNVSSLERLVQCLRSNLDMRSSLCPHIRQSLCCLLEAWVETPDADWNAALTLQTPWAYKKHTQLLLLSLLWFLNFQRKSGTQEESRKLWENVLFITHAWKLTDSRLPQLKGRALLYEFSCWEHRANGASVMDTGQPIRWHPGWKQRSM